MLNLHDLHFIFNNLLGGNPIHTAADANMTESVRVLVKVCGANLNKLLMKDTTPLYLAAQRGFTEVVSELVSLGANVNFIMPRGQHRSDLIPVSGEKYLKSSAFF